MFLTHILFITNFLKHLNPIYRCFSIKGFPLFSLKSVLGYPLSTIMVRDTCKKHDSNLIFLSIVNNPCKDFLNIERA